MTVFILRDLLHDLDLRLVRLTDGSAKLSLISRFGVHRLETVLDLLVLRKLNGHGRFFNRLS